MITIRNLSFRYDKRRPVLEDLHLTLHAGGVYGVLGANGVGKTTLLHLLSGLLFPKSGSLDVAGDEPARRAVRFLERLFYVPVSFELPALRVSGFCDRYRPFYPKFDELAWDRALKQFDVAKDGAIRSLSFGQKKKVLLSFALSSGCDLLLFDEPTDGLDIPSKDAFRRLLAQQIDEHRLAVITTHHITDVAALLDHLIILKDHRLLLDASLADLAARYYTMVTQEAPSEAVYSERVPGGYHSLLRNTDGHEGALHLELLFKALTTRPEPAL